MPHLSGALADQLLAAVLDGAPAAFPVCGGRPGHPVAIAAALFPDLQRLSGDQGARQLLRNMPGVVRIDTDDRGSLIDIDTMADLQSLSIRALSRQDQP
jgi:molybdenum cofactor cytidylyltransferase